MWKAIPMFLAMRLLTSWLWRGPTFLLSGKWMWCSPVTSVKVYFWRMVFSNYMFYSGTLDQKTWIPWEKRNFIKLGHPGPLLVRSLFWFFLQILWPNSKSSICHPKFKFPTMYLTPYSTKMRETLANHPRQLETGWITAGHIRDNILVPFPWSGMAIS